LLEAITLSGLSIEDVDEHLAVVHQHPFGVVHALDIEGIDPLLTDLLVYLPCDGPDVAVTGAGANNKVVGDDRYLADIEQYDILCFAVLGDIYNLASQFVWFQRSASLRVSGEPPAAPAPDLIITIDRRGCNFPTMRTATPHRHAGGASEVSCAASWRVRAVLIART
jgi:hypothetical protein